MKAHSRCRLLGRLKTTAGFGRLETSQDQEDETNDDVIEEAEPPSHVGEAEPPSHVLVLVSSDLTHPQPMQPIPKISDTCTTDSADGSSKKHGILLSPPISAATNQPSEPDQTSLETLKDTQPILITLDGTDQPPAKMSKRDALGRGRTLDAVWEKFHRAEYNKHQK
ncbi:unnamed protein product [Orchesella dallaii]|uniref:Uncharacterized protein n=1 Tax=Orchesella dallaii TaxID=48710 RepID=A0ABP1S1X2_9HEXA